MNDVVITIMPNSPRRRGRRVLPKPPCVVCGKPTPNTQSKYCSQACYSSVRVRPERTCEACGKTFRMRRSISKAYSGRACSRVCGFVVRTKDQAHAAAARSEARSLACDHPPMPKACVVCGAWFYSDHPNSTMCSDECRKERQPRHDHPERYAPRKCIICGSVFTRRYKSSERTVCSVACRLIRDRASTHAVKAKRRARMRGADSESVNAIKVFKRDGWRCQLCGCKTPLRLRGTYEDRAPELDHILPLSLGGPHAYSNTQCACRKCNQDKGAKSLGQTLIAI